MCQTDIFRITSATENYSNYLQRYGQLYFATSVAAGRYPEILRYVLDMAESFVLPERQERSYPRAVKKSPSRYATRPSRKRKLS